MGVDVGAGFGRIDVVGESAGEIGFEPKPGQDFGGADLLSAGWNVLLGGGLGYTIEGRENLPSRPFISLWKHSSAWETMAQMVVMPPQAWVLKREILWIPLVGWACWMLNPTSAPRPVRFPTPSSNLAWWKRTSMAMAPRIPRPGARRPR